MILDPEPPTLPYPEPIDETALRLDTFTPGVTFTLWDGQSWHAPRPMVRWADFDIEDWPPTSLGPAFDAAALAFHEAEDDTPDQSSLMFAVASSMLSANYRLDRADFPGLLVYDPDDPENVEQWGEIIDVAFGNGPRSLAQWRRVSLWCASGPRAEWVYLADLNAFRGMLVQSGRAVPANRWVDDLIREEAERQNDAVGPA